MSNSWLFEPLGSSCRPAAVRDRATAIGRDYDSELRRGWHAYTNIAIDQGHRAVKEVMAMPDKDHG